MCAFELTFGRDESDYVVGYQCMELRRSYAQEASPVERICACTSNAVPPSLRDVAGLRWARKMTDVWSAMGEDKNRCT